MTTKFMAIALGGILLGSALLVVENFSDSSPERVRIPVSASATSHTSNHPTAVAGVARAGVPAPRNLRVTSVSSRAVSLRWKSVPGADAYQVVRGRAIIARPRGASFTDRSVQHLTSYSYSVAAVIDGVATAPTHAVPATTRSAGPCTYWAAPSGSNSNSGSSAEPVRTITKLSDLLAPGDVGCVRGSHVEDVTVRTGGTAQSRMVIRSAPGTRARIRGRLWVAKSAPYVVLQDLNIDGRSPHSNALPSPTINATGVMLLHNDITNHRTGICVILGSVHGWGVARNTTVDSNRIHNCGRRPANNHEHGMYLENAIGARITNNVIYANADRGIQLFPNAQRSYIAHNVIDGNGEGIIFSGTDGYASSRNRVVDNVITNSRLRYNIEHWWPEGNPIGTGNRASRNCLWNGNQGNVSEPPVGFSISATLVDDPRYRRRAIGDFRPSGSSQCRHLLLGGPPLRKFG